MKLKKLLSKELLQELFTSNEISVGKIIIEPIDTPFNNGYKYYIITKIEDKERFGKPDKLIYSSIYFDDNNGYIKKSKENSNGKIAWLSYLSFNKLQTMISKYPIEKKYIDAELIPVGVVKKAFGDELIKLIEIKQKVIYRCGWCGLPTDKDGKLLFNNYKEATKYLEKHKNAKFIHVNGECCPDGDGSHL